MSKPKSFNMQWLNNAVKSVITFGKKNATSLMTGGGIILGWAAVYVFWKESRDAEKAIEHEEKKLTEQKGEPVKLQTKEKIMIYLQYCWLSALMGLGSTGLSLYSHKLDLDEIAKVYMLSQFYKDKSENTKIENERLKEEIKPKKLQEVEDEILEQQYPKDDIVKCMNTVPGQGTTLFIDLTTKQKFRGDIVKVTKGIMMADDDLKNDRLEAVRKELKSPYFSSDVPFSSDIEELADSDEMTHICSEMTVSRFLEYIGEITDTEGGYSPGFGELLVFKRDFCKGHLLDPNQILRYKKYEDPETGIPAVCFIDYADLLSASSELLERTP